MRVRAIFGLDSRTTDWIDSDLRQSSTRNVK